MTKKLECISPIDGSVYATRDTATLEEASAMVAAARAAQKQWAERPMSERIELVRAGVAKIGEDTSRMAEELAPSDGSPGQVWRRIWRI